MTYKVLGLMSGSSLDGLDLIFVHFQEQAGKWSVEVKATACYPYSPEWRQRLKAAPALSALDYCLLHSRYGHFLGQQVNRFTEENQLHLQIDLIASHGHTSFHLPGQGMTAQLGDGAAIAAETGVAVVSDLRNIDVALGGEGAPIVPLGEKLLFPEYKWFLNIGGIANISFHSSHQVIAFDVCPANGVLDTLAGLLNIPYDAGGQLAENGACNGALLQQLNAGEYYSRRWPKSLNNEYGTEHILPVIQGYSLPVEDKLNTYVNHIAEQVKRVVQLLSEEQNGHEIPDKLLVTGGGAFNTFLVSCMREKLKPLGIEPVVPDPRIVAYKEALIMALLGVLRWRENHTTLATVTGARRDSIGGALWMGQEGW